MNYYPHHIGDFNNATRHLTRIERSIYRDLIELYYDTERELPLDVDQLCRRVLARSEEERTAVEQVLNEFFNETEQGWFHERCDNEIAAYRKSTLNKSAAGKASAAKRATKEEQPSNSRTNSRSTDVEQSDQLRSTNQEPRTNNQNQKPEKKNYSALDALILAGVPEKVAEDWLVLRKKKNLPPTQTAIEGLLAKLADSGLTPEAGIRLCCERGWAGFDKSWLPEDRRQPVRPYQTRNDKARDLADRLTGGTSNDHADHTIIDLN